MFGLFGVVFSLILLIYLAYRGISILILAPLMAFIACLFSPNIPILATYTQVFMPSVAGFISQFFPVFLLGAIFGKLMDDSGSARSIAFQITKLLGKEKSILAVVLSCAILTYGGVSLFVVAFAVYPIANSLFMNANIPKRLIPACISLGAFTFTMTAMPGTPAIQNSIPMPYFGTTSFASPGIGIISSMIMFFLGYWWLRREFYKAKLNNETYGVCSLEKESTDFESLRTKSQDHGFDVIEITKNRKNDDESLPNFYLSITPIIFVVSINFLLSRIIFPNLDTSYLQEKIYGSTEISGVIGIWSIICSLILASILLIILKKNYFKNVKSSLDSGSSGSVLPILNTASLVGFGKVISMLPSFAIVKELVTNIGGGNPLISIAVSVNILAGITGSASGGMSIALQILAEQYIEKADLLGISHELLHRITTIATGGLDSLPHNGAVITLLSICKLTHRESYKDIFFVAVVFPIVALCFAVFLGSVWGSF